MKLLLLAVLAATMLATAHAAETKAQRDARMKWFREARFGMFIHWGVYAVPAGVYKDRTGHGEWIMETGQVPIKEYEAWRDQFNPVKFDAAQWAKIAKDAGMKYVVITTKHHDGFALFDSAVSDWDVMSTPFKRDIMKELSDAVRKEGLVQCWYHSIMDWHHPDYEPHRAWSTPQPADANFDRFEKYLHAQVSEVLTKYGPIGIMWFDGEWERTWNHERGSKLDALCRKLQPNVIVNNRVDVGRGGMAGMSDLGYCGDYGTPEQEIPAQGIPGVDWETCMTMNGHWGFNAADKSFKSTQTLIHMLCDIASKGGNFLLNVGPKADGTFPEESIQRLAEMGKWMKVNGEAIYGTTASPFSSLSWGRCTAKIGKQASTLYLHVFDMPKDGKLVIPGIGNEGATAQVLGSRGMRPVARRQSDLVIDLTGVRADPNATVVALKFKGKPIVYSTPLIEAPAREFVKSTSFSLTGAGEGVDIRFTLDNTSPTAKSTKFTKAITLSKTTTVKARGFHRGKAVTPLVEATFSKVKPWPSLSLPSDAKAGLLRYRMDGEFKNIADSALELLSGETRVASPGLGGFKSNENIMLRFSGYLKVPSEDLYSFALHSDDGSKLWIDGKVVINNDGLHSPEEKHGVAPLGMGWHKVELIWFNATGGAALDLRWRTGSDPYTKIPESAWRR